MTQDAHLSRLVIEGDNYKRAVLAFRAFAHEMLFDDESRQLSVGGSIHCGRTLRTSKSNRRRPQSPVTPDLAIISLGGQRLIVEGKFGFERDEEAFERRLEECIEQIEAYDDALTGWPKGDDASGNVSAHDVVLLVNFEDARRVAKRLQWRMGESAFKVERRFAIISFMMTERAEGVWPTLTLEFGELSDGDKTQKLDERLFIRPEFLDANPLVGEVELYDHPAPVPLYMDLIHREITTNLEADQQEAYNIDGEVEVEFTSKGLRERLAAYGFPRKDRCDATIPKMGDVRKALSLLVKMGWVEKREEQGAFVYLHKKGRKNYNNPYGRFMSYVVRCQAEEEDKQKKTKRKQEAKRQREIEKFKEEHPLLASQPDEGEDGYSDHE